MRRKQARSALIYTIPAFGICLHNFYQGCEDPEYVNMGSGHFGKLNTTGWTLDISDNQARPSGLRVRFCSINSHTILVHYSI